VTLLPDSSLSTRNSRNTAAVGVSARSSSVALAVAVEITERIEVVIEPCRGFRDLITTIPGIGPIVADIVTAETGADMSRFPTAAHLASWAVTTAGHNESAGHVKSTTTRLGNSYLQGALGAAAMSAPRTRGPTSAPDIGASPHVADLRKLTSRSSTRC
jgi:transposase